MNITIPKFLGVRGLLSRSPRRLPGVSSSSVLRPPSLLPFLHLHEADLLVQDLGQLGGGGQGLQPLDLDLDPVADQAELGEVLAQRGNLGFVAAVEGRQRGDGLQVHGEGP